MAFYVVYNNVLGAASGRPILRWGECIDGEVPNQAIDANDVAITVTDLSAFNDLSDEEFELRADYYYTINTSTLVISTATKTTNTDYVAERVNARAASLLAATAWTQTVEAKFGDTRRGEWATYRKALLDIATQAGYPSSVTFPTAPSLTEDDAATLDARLYRRANVLGSVGLASGVPNGGLFETNANANGRYIRFADGAQICQHNTNATFFSAGILALTWTFPAAFIATDGWSATAIMSSVDADGAAAGLSQANIAQCQVMISSRSATSVGFAIRSSTYSIVSGNNIWLSLTASGRWA